MTAVLLVLALLAALDLAVGLDDLRRERIDARAAEAFSRVARRAW